MVPFIVLPKVLPTVVVVVVFSLTIAVPLSNNESSREKAENILQEVPLIDGHNDLAYQYYIRSRNKVMEVPLDQDVREYWKLPPTPHTDIPRLRQGKVGAQFWAAYVSCSKQKMDAVRLTLQQIDVIKRYVKNYPDTFAFVTSAQAIRDAFKDDKIGSMIGVEGGHSIDSDLATLRLFYELGVRYMTITHSCNTPWAQSTSASVPIENGLTNFGKTVIKEMNRLGMLVDLSHVAFTTMRTALEVTEAPVIFSHSSAYALCNSTRNVPDDILLLVKENGGVVMVNFYNGYISCGLRATIQDVADHIDYIRDTIGADYVGIGSDYDGVARVPTGLEDVSKYPDLFAELIDRGWSDEDLKKLAGENLLRVFAEVERVRDLLAAVSPYDDWIDESDVADYPCRSTYKPYI